MERIVKGCSQADPLRGRRGIAPLVDEEGKPSLLHGDPAIDAVSEYIENQEGILAFIRNHALALPRHCERGVGPG